MGLCQPWVSKAAVKLRPDMDDIDDALVERAAAEASEFLFALSGRQFPGKCSMLVRPAARPRSVTSDMWTGQLMAWGFPLGFSNTWGVCQIAHNDFGYCANAREIDLLTSSVRDVTSVVIGGETLDPSAYRIDNYRLLTRTDGGLWPTCQRVTDPTGSPCVFEVTFEFGMDPPATGIEACTTMAAELAKYHSNKKNKLPMRLTQIVRQDVTMTVADPMQFLGPKGSMPLTGIWEIDLFLRTVNPNGQAMPPAVYSPDRQSLRVPNTVSPRSS